MKGIHAILGTHHIFTVEYLKEILDRLRDGDTRPGYTPEHYQARLVTTAEDAYKVIEYLVNGATAIREEITAAGMVGSEFTDMGGIKQGVKRIVESRDSNWEAFKQEKKRADFLQSQLNEIHNLATEIDGSYTSSIADDERVNQIVVISTKGNNYGYIY